MIKVIAKVDGEVKMISKDYYNNKKAHYDVYVEPVVVPKKVKKTRKPKVVKEVKEVVKETDKE